MINKNTKVKHKITGLKYIIIPKGKDSYYLAVNDGMVPSGQNIFWTEEQIWKIFERDET